MGPSSDSTRPAPPAPRPLTIESGGVELAGRLFLPAGRPEGALVVCHGAGSRKENHEIMGEQAAAAGLAALTFDFRGHGGSGGAHGAGRLAGLPSPQANGCSPSPARRGWRPAAPAWAAACCCWRRGRGRGSSARSCCCARPTALRCWPGSTTSATASEAAPADPQGGEYGGRFDGPALRPFLEALDLVAAASGMPRVLLAHARDDDSVPFAHSERLAAVLAPPTEFIALAEGGHHGPGRSPLVARATIDWVKANAG